MSWVHPHRLRSIFSQDTNNNRYRYPCSRHVVYKQHGYRCFEWLGWVHDAWSRCETKTLRFEGHGYRGPNREG